MDIKLVYKYWTPKKVLEDKSYSFIIKSSKTAAVRAPHCAQSSGSLWCPQALWEVKPKEIAREALSLLKALRISFNRVHRDRWKPLFTSQRTGLLPALVTVPVAMWAAPEKFLYTETLGRPGQKAGGSWTHIKERMCSWRLCHLVDFKVGRRIPDISSWPWMGFPI